MPLHVSLSLHQPSAILTDHVGHAAMVAGFCSYYFGETFERLTYIIDSEQMGPNPHLQRLQYWRPCLLRYLFCPLASDDGKASQICYSVSSPSSWSWCFAL